MNYTFESYLGRIKDTKIKKHHMQMASEGKGTLILESRDEYAEYVNYLIESKNIDVNSLTLEEQVLLAKNPEIFLELWGLDKIKDSVGKAWQSTKDSASKAWQGTKDSASKAWQGIKNIPKSISSGAKKALAVVKNISKGMMLKLKSFILKMAQPVIKLYHDMMKKKWFRMLIAIVVNVIFKFLTVFSLIKALITGEFLPKGKTTLAILKTIRNGVKDSEEKLNKIDNSIKKNEEDKIKNKEERKQLFNNSFDGNINYGGLFFEFRDFINNDFEVYNEDVYFYNELTASQIPHASSISLPAGQTRVGYGFKLNGEKLNIGVDIVDNSIYGFDKSGDFDDDELQEFLDIVFGKGKTISSNHYKWKKGEWKKIFAAIETGKVGSDSSKSGDSSSKDSDSRKGGGGDGGSGSYSGRRGRIERDTEDDEEIGYDDGGGNGRGGDGGDGDGYRVGKNKLHVSGNKNNIYINDDEDYNPKKFNEPNMGFWNWMSRNGAAIISGVLIGLALGFIAFHVWTFWMSMSSQLAAQGAQLAALEKGQATILTAIQNIKPGPKAVYNIMNNSGAIAFSGNATQTIYNGAAALAKVAPHM